MLRTNAEVSSYQNEKHVQEIYSAAKTKDINKLNQIKQHGISFDVTHGRCNAIMKCAVEGDVNAVNFLLDNGANKNWALKGMAMRGDEVAVKALLEKSAGIAWAIEGFAQGGHFNLMRKYIKGNTTKFSHRIFYGLVLGNHHDKVNELLNDCNEHCQSEYNNVNKRISNNSYSHVGVAISLFSHSSITISPPCSQSLDLRLNHFINTEQTMTEIYSILVEAYAIHNDVRRVEEFLVTSDAKYSAAVSGFNSIGNFYQAKKFEMMDKHKKFKDTNELILNEIQQFHQEDEMHMLEEILAANTLLGKLFRIPRYPTAIIFDTSKNSLLKAQQRLNTLKGIPSGKEESSCRIM